MLRIVTSSLAWVLLTVGSSSPAAAEPVDPRIPLIERQLGHDLQGALDLLDAVIAAEPERARSLGLHYLRGHLLLRLDRQAEALQAFADSMTATPNLAPWARLRLAVEQAEADHPEVAAGLAATLLGSKPPRSLVPPAIELLERTLADGGDCRLLRGLDRLRLATAERRRLDLARAGCAERGGDVAGAHRRLLALLDEDTRDDVAQRAAERLAPALDPAAEPALTSARPAFLVGLAYHHHREFDVAIRHLAQALVRRPASRDLTEREFWELRYELARGYFWLGRTLDAARAFGGLAAGTRDDALRARALYQRARCFELAGEERWDQASAAFAEVVEAEPGGGWAAAARIARVRLEWLRGREAAALGELRALLDDGEVTIGARALLFIASSDLVQGRADRAGPWLATAAKLHRLGDEELAYWQGRQAEAAEQPGAAVDAYLRALVADPYHPLGQAARRRLADDVLAEPARAEALRRARSTRPDDLYAAWQVLGDEGDGLRARTALAERLVADRAGASFVELDDVPAANWPLWNASLAGPEERLLALGLFHEAPRSRVMRHFPVREPALAFTGSLALSRVGAVRPSLYIAEVLTQRIPDDVPADLLPPRFRELLYPFRYSYLVRREAKAREIDPFLLAAIIREESRFDPDAFSGASARGLTQFVFPTAREIAASIDLGPIEPRDLHDPEVAIALGAAYLRQLEDDLVEVEEVVAAYNAGEPQAELWRRYCFSDEPEEYLGKVAFRETRNYLRKVLTSRAHYRALYATAPPPKVVVAAD